MPTPGHTAGHQALVVETAVGPVLLAGQAFTTASEFDSRPSRTGWRRAVSTRSANRPPAMARVAELDPIRTYFAHDLLVHERERPDDIAAHDRCHL